MTLQIHTYHTLSVLSAFAVCFLNAFLNLFVFCLCACFHWTSVTIIIVSFMTLCYSFCLIILQSLLHDGSTLYDLGVTCCRTMALLSHYRPFYANYISLLQKYKSSGCSAIIIFCFSCSLGPHLWNKHQLVNAVLTFNLLSITCLQSDCLICIFWRFGASLQLIRLSPVSTGCLLIFSFLKVMSAFAFCTVLSVLCVISTTSTTANLWQSWTTPSKVKPWLVLQ